MSRKVVIIGGVASGASAAAKLRRLDPQAAILVLKKGNIFLCQLRASLLCRNVVKSPEH
jgi:L-2-hydroxyglutarate oxidase LhgO